MTTLIQRDASIAIAQHYRYAIPGMRVKAATVQEKEGSPPPAFDHLKVDIRYSQLGRFHTNSSRGGF